ncbi:MAG: hypothetical protein RSA91_00325 [Bacilli bacterium]
MEKSDNLCKKFNVPVEVINDINDFAQKQGYDEVKIKKFTKKSGSKTEITFYIYTNKNKKLGSMKYTTYDFSSTREKMSLEDIKAK